jgi:hypothetical protein
MVDQVSIPSGGVYGWLVTVVRLKGQLPIRYYVGIGDEQAAMKAVRTALKLRDIADVRLRHALSKQDVRALKLRVGQVTKT